MSSCASKRPAHRGSGPARPGGGRASGGGGAALAGQGLRYAISGAVVMLVYLAATTLLAAVVRLPFQVALPIGFGVAVCVHFVLQRLFVWAHHEEFALPLRRQARRYVVVAGLQYGAVAASTALLPRALGVPTEAVYLVSAPLLASAGFLLLRNVVFHPETTAGRSAAWGIDSPRFVRPLPPD